MATQVKDPRIRKRIRRKTTTLVSIIALIIVAGSLWILSIDGTFPVLWSSILGAVFTILAVLIALLQLQWHSQANIDQPTSLSTTLMQLQRQHIEIKGVPLIVNKRRGALIVKVKKNLCGTTINLCRGFNCITHEPDFASCVIERKVEGRFAFVAIFPLLEPGNYTIYCASPEMTNRVSIYADQIVEVDWRRLPQATR